MSIARVIRDDKRRNHLSQAEVTRRASGAVKQLTPEEIATMDPNKPTETKRIAVDELPRVPETIAQTKAQIREAVQATARVICRKATRDLQLLDDKELQSLSTITLILDRLDKDVPIDPSKLTDEELEKKLKE